MGESTATTWRTSSFCAASECIQVSALSLESQVLVRDTADRDGPVLTFNPAAWRAFTTALKAA
jgi:hypothetical protein